jgi:hypothetical protein
MVSTTLEIALLVVLTQIPTMVMWFQIRALREDQLNQDLNRKTVVEFQADMITQLQREKTNLLDRMMAGDIKTYVTMTSQSALISSTSEVEVYEKPTSMSDEAEWARENNVSEEEVERYTQDILGLGNIP